MTSGYQPQPALTCDEAPGKLSLGCLLVSTVAFSVALAKVTPRFRFTLSQRLPLVGSWAKTANGNELSAQLVY
jgi:hypothetical protein